MSVDAEKQSKSEFWIL